MKIELNSKTENPFYGLKNCLNLFQGSANAINTSLLNSAYNEVKDDKVKREMFFSLLFSIGDVTARQHNIFGKKKTDSGGNSNRDSFFLIMEWIKINHYDQFKKFLNAHLFNEYTCFDNLFRSRVQTAKKKVTKVYSVFNDEKYRKDLVDYVVAIVRGNNPFDKAMVAKFLTPPRVSKRAKSKKMLPETHKVMTSKGQFLAQLSEALGWEYKFTDTYANFKGYREWRKDYNGELESVLFSTGKIKEFDKQTFLEWLNRLPSQARFRVRNRITFEKNGVFKYPNLKKWYEEWEKFKESKQAEQRVLEEKVRQGAASDEDKIKLQQVKKEAKVTVGSTNFLEIYESILSGRVDKLKLESFMNKVNLPYNSLTIIDDSGSMSGAPFNFANFIASVCLCKNPDDSGRNLLGFFNNTSRLYGHIDSQSSYASNSLMRGSTTKISTKPFIDPKKSFYDNYKFIDSFCRAAFQGGGTNISSIPDGFKRACDNNPQVLDDLKNYPIWTIISDGEWNNLRSPEASINDFFRRCENYFGYRPFIVAIDINNYIQKTATVDRFSGIDNMIYIPANPAQIEQFLTNFKDIDIFDIYTPLQSLYRSNRYDLVKANTL